MAASCERFNCEGSKTGICGNVEEINHQLGYFFTEEEPKKFVSGFEIFLKKIIDEVEPVCIFKNQLNPAIELAKQTVEKVNRSI